MKVQDVRARIEQMKREADAHGWDLFAGMREELFQDVLVDIAKGGHPYPAALAKEAIKALGIEPYAEEAEV